MCTMHKTNKLDEGGNENVFVVGKLRSSGSLSEMEIYENV